MGRVRGDGERGLKDAARGVSLSVSARAAAICALVVLTAALACRLLDAEQASTAALKVLSATLAVGIVPGALATLLWRPRPQLTALEVIGFGIAVSFGLVQLLTVLAISVHVSAAVIATMLLVASALMAARVIQRPSCTILVTVDELTVLFLVVALGVVLYMLGSPVSSSEDQIHGAIVRRLSQVAAPRLDNVYFTPGIVYTYPFPGIHYAMALVARLAEIDALFVYHKLRFFWGPAALAMLYLAARAVFGASAIACAVTVTAVALVCSGVFAMVPGFSWGWSQLAPYSHASDVAMTVLLPALLVVAFGYLRAASTRERMFFLTATAMLSMMLTAVHIREAVQFIVYIGCFLIVTIAFRPLRPYIRRTVVLLALAVVIATIYAGWVAEVGPLYSDVLDQRRTDLMSAAAASSLPALMFAPASAVIGDYLPEFQHIWNGLTPFFLFAGPAVIVLFWRQPLVWFIASSVTVYLALMSVPFLAIPYIYLTYYEILYTPVRNVMFFVYLLAGALLYATVVALTCIDRTRLSSLAAGTVGGALALISTVSLNRSHEGFFVPLIAAYGLTFLFSWDGPLARKLTPRTVVTGLVSLAALVMLWPDHPPVPRSEQVTIRWSSGLTDARRTVLEQQVSLGQGEPKPDRTDEVNVWNYRLADLSVDNVRAIVTHPDVIDTHFIDRSTFTVESQPPPGDQPLGVRYVRWVQYPGMLLLLGTAVSVWLLGLIVPAALASSQYGRAVASFEAAIGEPFYRRALPYALLIVPFALWSARPTLSPLPFIAEQPASVATPKAMVAQLPCVTTPPMPVPLTEELFPGNAVMLPARTTCPPDYPVIEWVRMHVPVEAVFAIDLWNPYLPSLFTPQQVVVLPLIETALVDLKQVFSNKNYSGFFDDRMRQYRVQPFFNSVETPAERAAFIEALGVTHVLVDPGYYDELRPVLDALPQRFTLQYASAKWAVYEVTGGAGIADAERSIDAML